MAAGEFHTLVFDDESVRIVCTIIPACALVPLHTHKWPSSIRIVSWSDFVRRDASGAITYDARAAEIKPLGAA